MDTLGAPVRQDGWQLRANWSGPHRDRWAGSQEVERWWSRDALGSLGTARRGELFQKTDLPALQLQELRPLGLA